MKPFDFFAVCFETNGDFRYNSKDFLLQLLFGIFTGTQTMLANYFPVLIFLAVGLIAGIVFILLGNILGPKRHYAQKDAPFECGFEAFENARMKFDVRYYLVAILFILFDLEVAFMIPWAVVYKELLVETGVYAFWSMFVFIVLLTVGFVYEWKKGALEWE